MREPLRWGGGTRQTASGLVIEVHTDEGLVGIGEAPGPTLPTIETIVERELSQFLVGQDPMRVDWLVHRMEEFMRNWNQLGVYASAGLEMARLDLKG
jgi:L-alanine-DL-glutamate epimerase-like enolase superfamily enzyme